MKKSLKRILAVIMSLVMMISIFALGGIVASADGTYNGLTFTISNEEVTITGYTSSLNKNTTVPNKICGYPVTRVAGYAFRNCTGINEISFESEYLVIEAYAFYYSEYLKTVRIPANAFVASDAFFKCTHLSDVYYYVMEGSNASPIIKETSGTYYYMASKHSIPVTGYAVYNLNGGNINYSEYDVEYLIIKDQNIRTPSNPAKDRYVFKEWECLNPEAATGNINFIAVWEEDNTPEPEVITYSNGDIIYFGNYPQSKVTDADTIEALNNAFSTDDLISYGYYEGDSAMVLNKPSDFMKYADVEYNGYKYRGVIINKYRPYNTKQRANNTGSNSYQDENGYELNQIYWFRYDPIPWRILDLSSGLVMSELLLDSQPFHRAATRGVDSNGNEYFYDGGNGMQRSNNYQYSSIRSFVIGTFPRIAFTDAEKQKVVTTNPGGQYGVYADAYFLLSIDEVTNNQYGFDTDASNSDINRKAMGTEYARCQGLFLYNGQGYYNWFLKTSESNYSGRVDYLGIVDSRATIDATNYGVRPAMYLKNIDSSNEHIASIPVDENIVENSCTEDGSLERVSYCRDCGVELKRENVIVPALGHDIISYEGKAATCAEAGYKPYDTCSRCDYTTYEEIPATGNHSWQYSTDKYTISGSCENCDATFSLTAVLPENLKCSNTAKEITITGEKPDGLVASISYDTDDGLAPKTAGKYTAHFDLRPDDLSDVILARIDIELVIEHDIVSHDGQSETCEEDGWEPYETCNYCDYTTYSVIPAKKHNYVASYEWSNDGKTCVATAICLNNPEHKITEDATITSKVKADSTCEDYGTTTYTATFNNELFTEQTKDVEDIQPKQHNYVASYEWSEDGKSCTATAICSNDPEHKFSEEGTISTSLKVKPTCTEKGTTTYTASFNNKFFVAQTKDVVDIPANGHTEVIQDVVNATCTTPGYTGTVFCSVCKQPLRNGEEKPALGHSFTNYVYNNDATYNHDGTETAKCNRCNETDTRTKAGTQLVNPTANARIRVANATTVDYRTKVVIKASAVNLDPAYHLVLVINGKEIEGNNKEVSYEYGEIKSDITYFVKIVDSRGSIQLDANGAELKKDGGKITCDAGFFKKIVAFFKGLFGALPEAIVKP